MDGETETVRSEDEDEDEDEDGIAPTPHAMERQHGVTSALP